VEVVAVDKPRIITDREGVGSTRTETGEELAKLGNAMKLSGEGDEQR